MIGEISPTDLLVLLGVAFAAAFLTRLAGVAISGRVEADTPVFHWFSCVGQALVGGLMVRAILFPSTPLGETLLLDRILAVGGAIVVFFLFRHRLLPSTLAGVLTLAALSIWRDL
jgi:branched-subunit amino acid transport protein